MLQMAVVYHSGYGHTEVVAKSVLEGVQKVANIKAQLIKISPQGEITADEWTALDNAHGIIFGTPTYMGSASGPFKMFMDASSKPWFAQKWKNKIASGFTNSGGLSGDKLCTLTELVVLAMQHGMIWAGNAFLPTGNTHDDLNRVSSFVGLMTQSDNADATKTPSGGDLKTAVAYGERVAQVVVQWNK